MCFIEFINIYLLVYVRSDRAAGLKPTQIWASTAPNGAHRSPDAAWVELSRWEALSPEQRQKFLPLAPDLAIELRSETDRMPKLREKMAEYRANGVKLGWLIDPQQRQVEIYRLGKEVEILQSPANLNGEDVLPGFTLSLNSIFWWRFRC